MDDDDDHHHIGKPCFGKLIVYVYTCMCNLYKSYTYLCAHTHTQMYVDVCVITHMYNAYADVYMYCIVM